MVEERPFSGESCEGVVIVEYLDALRSEGIDEEVQFKIEKSQVVVRRSREGVWRQKLADHEQMMLVSTTNKPFGSLFSFVWSWEVSVPTSGLRKRRSLNVHSRIRKRSQPMANSWQRTDQTGRVGSKCGERFMRTREDCQADNDVTNQSDKKALVATGPLPINKSSQFTRSCLSRLPLSFLFPSLAFPTKLAPLGKLTTEEDTSKTRVPIMEELNEYERQRQENILKNQELLRSLQLTASAIPSPKPTHAKPSTPRPKKKIPKAEPTPVVPGRRSSRLAGIPADSELAKRKADEIQEQWRNMDQAKKARIEGDLEIKLEKPLFSKGKLDYDTFTYEDVEATTDKQLKEIREKMMGLKLWDAFEPNREFLVVKLGHV